MRKIICLALTLAALFAVKPGFAAIPAEVVQTLSAAPASCGNAGWPGLQLQNGKVVSASILNEVDGYANVAGTTGGLGGRLVPVTSIADYASGEPPIPGSLRAILTDAARSGVPVWVTFSPSLGPAPVITLKTEIKLGDNVTIDGSCSNVTIQGENNAGLLYVLNVHNVLIDRLNLTNIHSDLPNGKLGSLIRLGGAFDAIEILHNEMSECGDKCVATTSRRGAQVPAQARVTLAFNYIHDHDKTLLFGSYNCLDGDNCTLEEAARNAASGPGLFMTMEGNVLIREAQRNPRVFGRAMLHAFDNYIAFQPYIRPNGQATAAYGIFVSNGARALIEHNWIIPLDAQKPVAIFTSGTPGTRAPTGDRQGFIRLEGGPQAPSTAIVGQNDPQEVPNPPYAYHALALETLPPDQALACLATRAGRNGATSWDAPSCKIAGN